MTRIQRDQVWKCGSCDKLVLDFALLRAPSPFDSDDILTGCPYCKQTSNSFDLMCDEPGCANTAHCGWPTGDDSDAWGGYRNTCFAHMQKAQRKENDS